MKKRIKVATNRRGFTLVEMVIVITILAIVASFAVPSILAYSETGRQINRDNVARTIYLAAQNRMTELRITKNLKAEITGKYYELSTSSTGGESYTIKSDAVLRVMPTNVFTNLGASKGTSLSKEEKQGNAPYLHYIKKDAGTADPNNPVVKLLDPILLDKTILNDAILIEYNIRTGVVLSVFYGNQGQIFAYTGTDKNSILGTRGMGEGGYPFARERKQGYYGVDQTGSIEESFSALVKVCDSNDHKLPDDASHAYRNLLYAELFVPKALADSGEEFDLRMNDVTVEKVKFSEVKEGHFSNDMLPCYGAGNCLLYRYDNGIEKDMARFVWILDYVGGNMADATASPCNLQHSIGVKYGGKNDLNGKKNEKGETVSLSLDAEKNLRVSLMGSVFAESATEVNPFFATEPEGGYTGDQYSLYTARHLYNVRYALNGNFTQKADIDLEKEYNRVSNFAPIGRLYSKGELGGWKAETQAFTGTFAGAYISKENNTQTNKSFAVSNLNIKLPSEDRVGLFATIDKRKDTKPSLLGVTLVDPNIQGKSEVGAICGELGGMMNSASVRYSADTKSGVSGLDMVGGMVGSSTGVITDSVLLSAAKAAPVTCDNRANLGGIIGRNDPATTLQRILYIAPAPTATDGASIAPFVGNSSPVNTAKQSNLYYLSGPLFSGTRPADTQYESKEYNTKPSNLGTGMDTYELNQISMQLGGKWTNANLTRGDAVSLNNHVYPYAYPLRTEGNLPSYPDWPIVDRKNYTLRVLYYERYSDDGNTKTLDYGLDGLEGKGLQNNRKIIEDGYLLYCDKLEDWTAINAASRTLFVSSSSNGANFVNLSLGKSQSIPNLGNLVAIPLDLDVLQKASLGSNTLYMKVSNGAGGRVYFEGYLNPLFAKAVYTAPQKVGTVYSIRTPRQVNNIALLIGGSSVVSGAQNDYKNNFVSPLGGTYRQEVPIDFAGLNTPSGYQMRKTVVDSNIISIDISKSVVSGVFKGNYDGAGKSIRNLTINGSGDLGLFQQNAGTIRNLVLDHAQITSGSNSNAGGIAAQNSGTIQLSSVQYSTITGGVRAGGITALNTGTVEDVYFLSVVAPNDIPIKARGSNCIIGGIVGENNGNGKVKRALYLAPAPANSSKKEIYPIVGKGKASEKENERETCFYLDGNRYSLDQGKTWVNNVLYNRIAGETKVLGGGKALVSTFIDKGWLKFAYQIDYQMWYQPPSGYIYPIIQNATQPDQWPVTDSPTKPDQKDRTDWETISPTTDRAGNINFINGDFEMPLMNPNNLTDTYPILKPGNNKDPWTRDGCGGWMQKEGEDEKPWYTKFNYYDYSWVQGWQTRPVDQQNGYNNPLWRAMEFQQPESTGDFGRTKTNYKGGSDGVYAELNAEVQGTLYQICSTKPGTQMYYSFYHASRHGGKTDQMTFYLSGMKNVNGKWTYANGTKPTPIRPCKTPRDDDTSYPTTRNTVKYTDAKFYNPISKQQAGGAGTYLYDVWVSSLKCGITFYSQKNVFIPLNGVTNITDLPSAVISDAQKNVIGYWDVKDFETGTSQWKQYYGLYTVPAGQLTTEFAYESNNASDPLSGNYLDGISFQSPSFLSVDQSITYPDGQDQVRFVSPGETLTVQLTIQNHGETTAQNISIENRLDPFEEYINDIDSTTVEILKNGTSIGCSPTYSKDTKKLSIQSIDATLKPKESLTVTFQIKVRDKLLSNSEVSTLQYYFKNQAKVSYSDADFLGYQSPNKTNGSNILQVFIDPIKLSKTVTNSSVPIDGPFQVSLKVEKVSLGKEDFKGLINDVIPAGFEISNRGNLPNDAELNPDGRRLSIPNVNLNETEKTKEYHYTLRYTDSAYGVFYAGLTADYKYLYQSESARIQFPQPLVGISIKTGADDFTVSTTQPVLLDITANDSLTEKHADDNYDVTPEIVLIDASGKEAKKNANGDYQLSTDQYTAVLLKSESKLQFTPKANADGTYTLSYRIKLDANRKGGNPEHFDLSSPITPVTVHVSGSNKLVYYEQYNDSSYGFYSGEELKTIAQLDNVKVILPNGWGYGVLSQSNTMQAQLGTGNLVTTPVNVGGGWYLYKFSTSAATNWSLQTVKFGIDNKLEDIGKLHPNFAKAIYPPSATDAGTTFYIRTNQQNNNRNQVDVRGKTFTPERGIVLGIANGLPDEGSVIVEMSGESDMVAQTNLPPSAKSPRRRSIGRKRGGRHDTGF